MSLDISKLKSLNVSNARPKLTASDAAASDYFGRSVAFSNNGLLAIGARADDDNGKSDSGSVYLFSGSGTNWTQQAKLTASDADSGDHFGVSVAFSNNGLLAIGARADDNKGSVYLFSGSGTNWTQQAKLTASDAATSDNFGISVAFSNNGLLAIGAYGVNPGTTGAVYLFSGSGKNWTQIHKLIGSNYSDDTDNDIWFGSSVAFSKDGNVLAIGAENDGNTKTGSVYLLSGSGTNWTQIKKITAYDAAASDNFGNSVAFSNNGLLAIGAIGDDDNGKSGSGSVYLFSGSGTNWREIKKITAYDAEVNDQFGMSVAFSNNGLLAIGSWKDDDNNKSDSGSVYLYVLPLEIQKKKKSHIQISNHDVDDYVEGDEYNGRTILGIVKTRNVNDKEINYLIIGVNSPYYNIIKAKNDKETLKYYQDIYKNSAEIYNYIESLL